jgi:hypothetical protein
MLDQDFLQVAVQILDRRRQCGRLQDDLLLQSNAEAITYPVSTALEPDDVGNNLFE